MFVSHSKTCCIFVIHTYIHTCMQACMHTYIHIFITVHVPWIHELSHMTTGCEISCNQAVICLMAYSHGLLNYPIQKYPVVIVYFLRTVVNSCFIPNFETENAF
jgi:hypothetical protein